MKSIIDRMKSRVDRKKRAEEKKLTYAEKISIALLKLNRKTRREYCFSEGVDWADVPHMPREVADYITKHRPRFNVDIRDLEKQRNKYAYMGGGYVS
jgi:hypothetical protein